VPSTEPAVQDSGVAGLRPIFAFAAVAVAAIYAFGDGLLTLLISSLLS
jgi:hypothetical protein